MSRPTCHACGHLIPAQVTAIEVRGPHAPAAAFVACGPCAEAIARRLAARRPGLSLGPPARTVARGRQP